MKTFEELLHREQYNSESKERAALKRRSDRQQTREERKRNKTRATYIAIVVAWGLFVAALLAVPGLVSKSRAVDTPQPESPAETTTDPFVETNQQAQEHMLEHSAEVSQNLQEQFRAEIEEAQVPKAETPMDDAVTMLAKLIYGEARGCSTMEKAAVVWNVLNRVEHPAFPDDIESVVLQRNAYAGYSPDHPATEEHMRIAEDVLDRWTWEKWDGSDYGRVLPGAYVYFHGDGKVNWYRMEYEHTGEYWDWSFPNPYEEE